MGETKMAQQMGVQERFNHSAVEITAGSTVVPCASPGETLRVTLAPFKDHGRPAFIASTIKSIASLQEAARALNEQASQRLNDALTRNMETLLDEGSVKSDVVLKSSQDGKPDIHMEIIGDPYKDNSLRLYYHLGEYQGARVIFQDARTTRRGSERVERTLKQEGGYQAPHRWDHRKRD